MTAEAAEGGVVAGHDKHEAVDEEAEAELRKLRKKRKKMKKQKSGEEDLIGTPGKGIRT